MKHNQTMKNMTLAQAYKQQFGKLAYPFVIYDADGKLTYHENSRGYWWRYEYDANGHRTYYETSSGRIEGQKQTIEIDGVEYSADQVRERIAELKPIKDQ